MSILLVSVLGKSEMYPLHVLSLEIDSICNIDQQTGFNSGLNNLIENDMQYTYDNVDGSGMTAQMLCQQIAESWYKEVPELEKVMPKKNSKILNSGLQKKFYVPKDEELNLKTGMGLWKFIIWINIWLFRSWLTEGVWD